jgi:hypothetical protein
MDTKDVGSQGVNHGLSLLPSMTSDATAVLAAHWITSVEQFVAAAAPPSGRAGLNHLLTGGSIAVDALLRECRDVLGTERFDSLMQARPGGSLGARFDDPARPPARGGTTGGLA